MVSVSAVMGDGGKFIGPGANSTPKAGGAGGAMGGPTLPARTSDSDSRSLSSLQSHGNLLRGDKTESRGDKTESLGFFCDSLGGTR
jgi:hypothetical protein